MTKTINKQALRNAALHAKITSDWGCDADNFHDRATPDAVLSLLGELEAAEKRIAELEERQNLKPCPKCNDTGMADSGGTHPWGEPIEIECDCRQQDANTAELVAAGIITKVGE